MKIDLMQFIEYNKNLKTETKELEFKKELKELIKSIMDGDDYFVTDNNLFIDKLNLKPVKSKKGEKFYKQKRTLYFMPSEYKYKFNLTKSNIKLVQDYINKEKTNE